MVNMIPIPSINANKTPPTTAADAMALGPALPARIPPVAAPLTMLFQGSSYSWNQAIYKYTLSYIQNIHHSYKLYLLTNRRQRAIATGKESSPHGKLTSQHGRSRRNEATASAQFASGGRQSQTLDAVPNAPPDGAHAKGATDVVDNSPRTRLSIGHSCLPWHDSSSIVYRVCELD